MVKRIKDFLNHSLLQCSERSFTFYSGQLDFHGEGVWCRWRSLASCSSYTFQAQPQPTPLHTSRNIALFYQWHCYPSIQQHIGQRWSSFLSKPLSCCYAAVSSPAPFIAPFCLLPSWSLHSRQPWRPPYFPIYKALNVSCNPRFIVGKKQLTIPAGTAKYLQKLL